MSKHFTGHKLSHGLIYDYSDNEFPSILHGFTSEDQLLLENESSTYYGYVQSGVAYLYIKEVSYPLLPGMYFSVNGKSDAFIIGGCGIVVERIEHSGVTIIGGPIEQSGRLKYIDGCTDSLLIPPVKMGDPCFNALYFPKGIDQTMHTHPSMRVGIVTKGEGVCITPDEKIQLKPGTVFIIHPEGEHKFRTIDKEMVVIAYHPDSDYGPVDQFHPMINRTIVKGISANSLPEIQTK